MGVPIWCPNCGGEMLLEAGNVTSFNVRGSVQDQPIVTVDIAFLAHHMCKTGTDRASET